ncbi:unnamed protein product [Amoebophrya sp. A120]|nr:unnamed protein product [Amoebophrya sp. A120]|eukprot:GSA120T00019021001.1
MTSQTSKKVRSEAEALVANLLAEEDEDPHGLSDALTRAFSSGTTTENETPDAPTYQSSNTSTTSGTPYSPGEESEPNPQPSPGYSDAGAGDDPDDDDNDDDEAAIQHQDTHVVHSPVRTRSPTSPSNARNAEATTCTASSSRGRAGEVDGDEHDEDVVEQGVSSGSGEDSLPQRGAHHQAAGGFSSIDRAATKAAMIERLLHASNKDEEPEPEEQQDLPPSAQVRRRMQDLQLPPDFDFGSLPGFDERKRQALAESLQGIKKITTEYKRIQDEMSELKNSLYSSGNGFGELAGTLQDMRGIRQLLEEESDPSASSTSAKNDESSSTSADEEALAKMIKARFGSNRISAETSGQAASPNAQQSERGDLSAELEKVIQMVQRKNPKAGKANAGAGSKVTDRQDLLKAINQELSEVEDKKKNLLHVRKQLSQNIERSDARRSSSSAGGKKNETATAEFVFGTFLFLVAVYLSSKEVRALVKEWWALGWRQIEEL